jgi:hypothetical protein
VTWKCPTSPVAKKFKSQPSAGKIMLTVFCDMEGAILVHFTSKGPDIATSDFHKFGPMKAALRGRRFSSDEKVILIKPIKDATNKLSSDGIKKLWNRCVEVEEDYVEK